MSFDIRRRPRAPRGISIEARVLIDQAIAAGRVRRIPMGVSGLPGYCWDGQARAIVAVNRPDAPARPAGRPSLDLQNPAVQAQRRMVADQARERREQLLRMADEGHSAAAIAAMIGVSASMARRLLRRARAEAGGTGDG